MRPRDQNVSSTNMEHVVEAADEDANANNAFEGSTAQRFKLRRSFLYLLAKYLSCHLDYPQFSADYVERVGRQPVASGQEAAELVAYQQIMTGVRLSGTKRFLRHFIALICVGYFASSLSFPLAVLTEVNFKQPATNFKQLAQVPQTSQDNVSATNYQFVCIISDCSFEHLASEQMRLELVEPSERADWLARDLFLLLPHFIVCHPLLSFFNDGSQNLAQPGLLMSSAMGFTVLLGGFILPLMQQLARTVNLFFMFLLAPRATRRMVRLRATELLDDMDHSYQIYRVNGHWFAANPIKPSLVWLQEMASRQRTFEQQVEPLDDYLPQWSDRSEQYRTRFAIDCVSAIRSSWWHATASHNMYFISAGVLGNMLLQGLLISFLLMEPMRSQKRHIQALGTRLQAANCSIWKTNADGCDNELLDLSLFQLNISLTLSYFYVLVCLCSFISITVLLIIYLLTNAELTCWLYELDFQLKISLSMLNQILSPPAKSHDELAKAKVKLPKAKKKPFDERQLIDLNPMKRRFESLASLLLYARRRRLSQRHLATGGTLPEALESQKFAYQLIEMSWRQAASADPSFDAYHQWRIAMTCELVEKLYVAFRIYLEQVRHCEPTISIIICIIHLYTYVYVVIGVLFLSTFDDFYLLSFLLMSLGWVTANFFILSAANVHAKGRQLERLVWSLLATICNYRSPRLQHAHLLWFKQVVALDMDSSLALRAFTLPITHGRIIQIVLGSATLLIFALHYGIR